MRSTARIPGGAGAPLVSLFLFVGNPATGEAQQGGSTVPDSAEERAAVETPAVAADGTGLYTDEQAERGEAAFRARCAGCHVSSQFRGEAFRLQWEGRTAFDLVDQIRATMPYDDPGGLSTAQYVDVVAYLLRLNSYAEGKEELPTDDARLKELRIPEHP